MTDMLKTVYLPKTMFCWGGGGGSGGGGGGKGHNEEPEDCKPIIGLTKTSKQGMCTHLPH